MTDENMEVALNSVDQQIAKNFGEQIGLSLAAISVIVKALKLQPNFNSAKFDVDILEILSKQSNSNLRNMVLEVLNISPDTP